SPLDIYNNPINRFVFSFIGLSNFLSVMRTDDGFWLQGGERLPEDLTPPESAMAESGERFSLASRPSEIDFCADGGLRGIVGRKSFLGEIVDYQIKIGDQELRVQKSRRAPGPDVGAPCSMRLLRPFWYTDK
ncbi:MAG: TOBE domain-containing protein, partial [Synergistaceae bacterium]|nr:TOBE domain-containing protein [Synergistaceae bacterium]